MNDRLAKLGPPICARHGVTLRDVMGRSRKGPVIAAIRDICAALDKAGMHPTQIGRALGRDRTTILHHLGRTKHP